MAIPESFLRELEDRCPIEEVVGDYVRLTKRTGANLFGLCPFHSEKTPSFSVHPERQMYHCFGCGQGGGVVNFIMEIENLSFPDAVEFLARRAGLKVPESAADPRSRQRERLLEANRDAARFFYDCMKTAPDRESALSYIQKRGISPAMVKRFGIGFAPDSWTSLFDALTKKGYSVKELADAGLARHGKNGSAYDYFRNRLMFPVIDVRGNVIGFSGRILGDGEPKYLNSPDTLVFSKSRNLFALNLAKKSKNGYIILSEGNIDVVALHQAGFDGAVASLGTALTAEQARLLTRYTKEIVIAFDSDEAGKKAAQRAIGILDKLDLRVRVLGLTGAKDPDEFIKSKGADAFRNLLERSENHIEYRLGAISAKYDLAADDQRVSFLKEATALLAELSSPVERGVYAGRVAALAGVGTDLVESETARLKKRSARQSDSKYQRESTRPVRTAQPEARALRYEDTVSAIAEEGVLRLLSLDPSLFSSVELGPEDFSSELLGRLYATMKRLLDRGDNLSMNVLSAEFDAAEVAHLTGILRQPESLANSEKALSDYIKTMQTQRQKREGLDFAAAVDLIKKQKQGNGGES